LVSGVREGFGVWREKGNAKQKTNNEKTKNKKGKSVLPCWKLAFKHPCTQ
jgi:hypothetical protein